MRICTHCGHRNRLGVKQCVSCHRPVVMQDRASLSDIAQDPRLLIGRVINGKYEVQKVLGEGGMGVVYRVRHLILKNRNLFALKILHPKFSSNRSFQERFLREVEVAMDLTHENVVQIRDFGLTEDELLFFTMDFFPGETLKELLRREVVLDPVRVAGIARALIGGLGEAHRCGVVHRDLKPENILIRPHRQHDDVRILDFGIAKLLEASSIGSSTLTQGSVIGTPKYMSPEQASGEPVDARSDFYSLGVVLYELLTGKAPFTGKTLRQIVVAHLSKVPASFNKARPDLAVPAKLERFVLRLLAKEPSKRPAGAEECLQLLHETGTLSAPSSRAAGSRRRQRRRPRRRRMALVAAVFVSGLLGLVVVFPSRSDDRAARAHAHALSAKPYSDAMPVADSPGSEGGSRIPGNGMRRREDTLQTADRAADRPVSLQPERRGGRRAPGSPARTARRCALCERVFPPAMTRVRCPCNGPLLPVRPPAR